MRRHEDTVVHAEQAAQGHKSEYRDFEMRIVPASPDLAERLGVDEGDSVVSRSFTRHLDGEPSSLQDSYYPMDIAQECGLLTPHDVDGGAIRANGRKGPHRDRVQRRTAARLTLTIFPGDRNRLVYELGDISGYKANGEAS